MSTVDLLTAAAGEHQGALHEVLPAAAAAAGMGEHRAAGRWGLPRRDKVVVVLVDGLGADLLADRGGHAPFLRGLPGPVLRSPFPSTTATSMACFGTGRQPGEHGMLGYQVLDPHRDALLNELAWDPAVDPRDWQRGDTVFERTAEQGLVPSHVGPGMFAGSGLTEAALRGARYVAAESLDDRVAAAAARAAADPRALVFLYWGDLDKTGHVHGCGSWQWGEELTKVDAALKQLRSALSPDTLLLVTADHGMVDIPFDARIDLAEDAELADGVRFTGGEPRAPMLYCEQGRTSEVAATWRRRFEGRALVLEREELLAERLFGPRVADHVLARVPDVVVSLISAVTVHDSRVQRPALARLFGMHGAATAAEMRIPLLIAE